MLRHFLTGKVITIADKIDDETYNPYLDDPNLLEKDQIFQLQPAKKGQTAIAHGSFVKIVYNEYELQKSDVTMPEISVAKQRTRSLTGIESFYKRL